MANLNVPKEQKTAYERWEMSAFPEDKESLMHANANKNKKKQTPEETQQLAQIFEGIRKEAYNKGIQEGFTVGMAKAKELAQQDKRALLALTQAFSDALEKSDEQIANDVLSLALDIAKSMLKVKLNVDTKALLPVVLDAIHYLPTIQKPARILAHHDDVQMLREYMADEISNDHWQIQEDANIERGGCLVETGANQVDATNAMRWKRITEALAQHDDWLLP